MSPSVKARHLVTAIRHAVVRSRYVYPELPLVRLRGTLHARPTDEVRQAKRALVRYAIELGGSPKRATHYARGIANGRSFYSPPVPACLSYLQHLERMADQRQARAA